MIIESILNILYNVFISKLPDISMLEYNALITNSMNIMSTAFKVVFYFLDVTTFLNITKIILALWIFRTVVAVWSAIKNAIPFL